MSFLTFHYVLLLVLVLIIKHGDFLKLPKPFDEDNSVNGKYSNISQFPYQVYIFTIWERTCNATSCFAKGMECGGTLISHDWIITATHCMLSEKGDRFANASQVLIYAGLGNADIFKLLVLIINFNF